MNKEKLEIIHSWVSANVEEPCEISVASNDASFRSYWRLSFDNDTTGGAVPANCETSGGFSAAVFTGFSGITTNPTGNKLISLGMEFTNGLANSEINKGSGEIIYIDNRSLISRNERQKEDVKIILEF